MEHKKTENKIEYMDAQPFVIGKKRTGKKVPKIELLDGLIQCVAKAEGITYNAAVDVLCKQYPEVIQQFKAR